LGIRQVLLYLCSTFTTIFFKKKMVHILCNSLLTIQLVTIDVPSNDSFWFCTRIANEDNVFPVRCVVVVGPFLHAVKRRHSCKKNTTLLEMMDINIIYL